jgi:hypothetical protein
VLQRVSVALLRRIEAGANLVRSGIAVQVRAGAPEHPARAGSS